MPKQTALVTGCSEGGIGAEIAKAFAKRGFKVYAAVRTPAKAASIASDVIEVVKLDVASKESIEECRAKIEKDTNGACCSLPASPTQQIHLHDPLA